MLCHFIYKGFEHPQSLVSAGGPGTNPPTDSEGQLYFDYW